MGKRPLHEVVAANLRAIQNRPRRPKLSQAALGELARPKLPQRTVGRILAGDRGCNLSSIEALSAGLGIAPWALLVDGFDPDAPPEIVKRDPPGVSEDELEQLRQLSKRLSPAQREVLLKDSVVAQVINGPTAQDERVAKHLPPAPKRVKA